MASFKYIIRTNKGSVNKDGTTIIFLRYTNRGKTAYFTTRKRIPIDAWNHEMQQVKRSFQGFSTVNMFLTKFKRDFEDIVNRALYDSIDPTPQLVRNSYELILQGKQGKHQKVDSKTFELFVDDFIEESKRTKKKATIRGYEDFVRILSIYKKSRRIKKLIWESFDMDWYYDFMDFYIDERGASNNTFGKMIKTLKTFLNAATEQGFNTCLAFKDKRFKVYQEEVSHIYLNEDEIQKLLDLDLSNNVKSQTIRDLFVVACYTGLRFSDFKQINDKNIIDGRLRIKTEKTGKFVVIPFHPIVKTIIDSYNGSMPRSYCNMVINRELKKIGKLAGFHDKIVKIRTHGLKRKENIFEKWQLLSTHCARRSFATNLFKQGFPAISIMKITGHKSEKTFMRYIKITEDEVASMLEDHWSEKLNEQHLSVA